MAAAVDLQIDHDVATIRFVPEREGRPPTLDLQTLEQLEQRVESVSNQPGLRAVMLRSAAAKYFVVGADVNALKTLDDRTIVPWVQRGHQVFDRLQSLALPTIAVVGGYCLGGGLELAMACDLIIATNAARFGMPEASLGLIPGWGGTRRLPLRVGAGRARLLTYTGRTIDAATAERYGLVDLRADDEAALSAEIEQILSQLRSQSQASVDRLKRLLAGSGDTCEMEAAASVACMQEPDTQARLANFFAARRAKSGG